MENPKAFRSRSHVVELFGIRMASGNNMPVCGKERFVLRIDQKAGCHTARLLSASECLKAECRSRKWINGKHWSCAENRLTRIGLNYSAKFCGIIPSNPELAAGERGKMPQLRKDDGFRICWQATPARRVGQRTQRDEQTNHGFGLKKIWELRRVWQNLSSHKRIRDLEIEVPENFHLC